MTEPKMHIGFDDTDSRRGGCTTYVAALIIEKLKNLGAHFADYPSLVRLNPNVPWKTRGNGALCLRILCSDGIRDRVKELTVRTVEEESDLDAHGTDPGIVFLEGEVPDEVEDFADRTITGVVTKSESLKLIKKFGAEANGFNKGRGIIGGLAAIGAQLRGDHTFEYITYRVEENRGTPRRIDESSVAAMDRQMGRSVFNNVDAGTGRILIMPRGPDPILYGIRGETPEAVRRARGIVVSLEPVERWVVFRTNQGTDAHLKKAVSVGDVKAYNPVVVQGEVASQPRIIQGGHAIFRIKDETGSVDCAAYEPTGPLRDEVMKLIGGDLVELCGGVRPKSPKNPLTINIEKLRTIKLAPLLEARNPLCPKCGKRTKSMGKGQGFECPKCGFHGPLLEKIAMEVERRIELGLFISPPRSQRHLTKPLERYGLEKTEIRQNVDATVPYDLFYGR
jgi:tRNA(Ile2)-agmatinylcytidine synthase